MEERQEYNPTAKIFHWTIVLFVILQFTTAWIIPHVMSDKSLNLLFTIHLSFGLTILLTIIARIFYRLMHKVPSLPADMPSWQVFLAHLVHYALYALLIIMPITGWLWASSLDITIKFFGLIPLPHLVNAGSSFGRTAGMFHTNIATAILFLVGAHVLAALYHAYVRKDGVMESMLPRSLHFLTRPRDTIK